MQNISVLTLTVVAMGAIGASRFVGTDGTQAGSGANTVGVSRSLVDAGDAVPVEALGTALVETGGPVNGGQALQSDAQGRAIAEAGGAVVARALPGVSATGAGEIIEVLLIPN